MAIALELDPEQISCTADKKGGGYDRPPGSPLDVHPAAIQAASDLLDRMYQSGLLDLLRGMASSGSEIAAKLAEGADSAQTIRAIRNGITLLTILGSIDPAVLQGIARPSADPSSPASPHRPPESAEPPSLFALFRRFSSSDSRRGLTLLANALESLGRAAHAVETKAHGKAGS